MRTSVAAVAAVWLASFAVAQKKDCIKLVSGERLDAAISVDAVLARAQKLQDIAYSTEGRNRQWQQPGFDLTMEYIEETLEKEAPGYYNVERQPTAFKVARDPAPLVVNGVTYDTAPMTTTTDRTLLEGKFDDVPIVAVANLGCDAEDYPASTAGALALVQRGTCSFELKSQLSKAAGAVGAIVRNAVDSPTFGNGVLGDGVDDKVPTTMLRYEDGIAILAQLEAGPATADLTIESINLISYNVVATTKFGNQSNVLMLGAHADSVAEGPGINDDGSGTVAILETAVQLAKFGVRNAVRFAWWTAEEDGLLGSYYYTDHTPAEELAKIRAYLNFDMIGSSNYVYGILDGDGDAYGLAGPKGSDDIEELWENYFESRSMPSDPSEFSGRSDYAGFIDAGIPSGGLTTGADEVKTAEQVAKYGGVEGAILDPNYHSAFDTVANLSAPALGVMSKAIGFAVGTYARSFDGFPARGSAAEKRSSKHSARISGLEEGAESFQYGPKTLWRL